MAALPEPLPCGPAIADLRRFSARELDPLLAEETGEWARVLDWDFSHSAGLVRKFADSCSLTGYALLGSAGDLEGYGYTVLEDHKGLIGDIFVRAVLRADGGEARLFRVLLDSLIHAPGVSRIESQLMLAGNDVAKAVQRERFVRLFDRVLMAATEKLPLSPSPAAKRFYLEPWGDHHQESAATVISLAYDGHIDARINDQYRSLAGARRFVYNIVQFPGCGKFYRQGSFVAFERATGWIAGIVLVSFVAEGVAHIAQLCVTPYARHTGLGYELLCRATFRLHAAGARKITLTVTAANADALRLYERCGYRPVRRFHAFVWESY